MQDGSDLETREAADMLAERTNADVVQVNWPSLLALYRESSRDDIEKIKLV